MALNVKDLCRLCATNDEFSKDLLDQSNKNILEMIQDVLRIFVHENDTFPTKICSNCEEKMITFQIFMMECYKAQDTIKDMVIEIKEDLLIKTEQLQVPEIKNPVVKSEMNDETVAEDAVSTSDSDKNENPENKMYDADMPYLYEDDDYLENITISTLKKIKKKQLKQKIQSRIDKEKLNEILKSHCFKVKDLVAFECLLCPENKKNWNDLQEHYADIHNSEPFVVCICGREIKSKATLYKHYTDHKAESRKLNNIPDSEEDSKQNNDEQTDTKSAKLKPKDLISFKCQECGKKFKSWYVLHVHCECKHNLPPIVQCQCGVTLKSKTAMYKHVQDHKNTKGYPCDICSKRAKSIRSLQKHKLRHIPKDERQYTCVTCGKTFTTKDGLKSHERSHIPVNERKIYHCEVCNLKFTTKSSASSHKRVVHDKVKSYVCDLCGYACGTGGELRQHRAIHSDEKPFACEKCSKRFKTYANYKTHSDTHEDTSYECYICRKVLNSRRTLRKHLLVHEDKCSHVCSYCNKAFKRRQTLKVHMYTHTGDKPLTCKWCDERFAYASTLRSHRLRCHPDKMAAQSHTQQIMSALQQPLAYQAYNEHVNIQESYIKDDGVTVDVSVSVPLTKNEVETV